jgi:hypothetical protein
MKVGNIVPHLMYCVVAIFLTSRLTHFATMQSSSISTNGLCIRHVEADFAELCVRIDNRAAKIEEATEKRRRDKEAVTKFLQDHGVVLTDVEDSGADVVAVSYGEDSGPRGRSFRIGDHFVVRGEDCHKLKEIGSQMSSVLSSKGIELSANCYFYYKKIDDLRPVMLEEATKDARARADRLAAVSGRRVSGLRRLETGLFSVSGENASEDCCYEDRTSLKKQIRVVVRGVYNIM